MSALSESVSFTILLNDEIIRVSAKFTDSIAELFQYLRAHVDYARFIPPNLPYSKCNFYRVKQPVSLVDGKKARDINKVKTECWRKSNRILIPASQIEVGDLADDFFRRNVYLTIDCPVSLGKSDTAIFDLRTNRPSLFSCLRITVKRWRQWSWGDVGANLDGGDLIDGDDDDNKDKDKDGDSDANFNPFNDILAMLRKKRVYRSTSGRELDNACSYAHWFDAVFEPAVGASSPTVTSGREFVAFYNVLRCFDDDVGDIKKNTSSALKASNFTLHFIQPPFFSEGDDSRRFEYQQETSWDFPIFLDTKETPGAFRKFVPRSDWMVVSKGEGEGKDNVKFPFIISGAISQASESDRYRMLVQAIALARTGQYLLKSSSKKKNFVVAVYIDKNMVASRYLVRQTDPDSRKVFILRNNFHLAEPADQIKFLREMYNLTTLIADLSGELDEKKKTSLSRIKEGAQDVVSLSTPLDAKKPASSTRMPTTEEERTDEQGRDRVGGEVDEDLGIFKARVSFNV